MPSPTYLPSNDGDLGPVAEATNRLLVAAA